MANTYKLIQAVTLTTTASTVTLGSGGTIPQIYTDLKVIVSGRSTRPSQTNDNFAFQINGDTGNNYSFVYIDANSGSPRSGKTSSPTSSAYAGIAPASTSTSNTFTNTEIYMPNYTSNFAKSFSVDNVNENNSSSNYFPAFVANIWNPSTQAPITSISFILLDGGGVWATYSSFYLYGIKNS